MSGIAKGPLPTSRSSLPTASLSTDPGTHSRSPSPTSSLSMAPATPPRSPSPTSSEHGTSSRSPSPTSSEHETTSRSPSPTSSEHGTSSRSPSPTSSEHKTTSRSPSPTSSEHGTTSRSPSPTSSPLSPHDGRSTVNLNERRKVQFDNTKQFKYLDMISESDSVAPRPITKRSESDDFGKNVPGPSTSQVNSAGLDKPGASVAIDGPNFKPPSRSDDSRQPQYPSFFDGEPMTLHDILCKDTPECPKIYLKGKLQTTRGASTFDYNLPEDQQLRAVVYQYDLIDQVEPYSEAMLKGMRIDPSSKTDLMFVTAVDPDCTPLRTLPNKIRSEHDTEDWVWDDLVRPALTAYQAVKSKSLKMVQPGDKKYHLTAGNSTKKTIPDGLLSNGRSDKASIEIKSHGAFSAKAFSAFSELYELESPCAVGFVWPGLASSGDKVNDTPVVETHEADLLVQVWSQMVDRKMCWGALSSYETSLFFYREEETGTLYVSRPYRRKDKPILAWFSFIALAFKGIAWNKVQLLQIDKRPIKRYGTRAGFDERTFPRGMLKRAAEAARMAAMAH